jgi:hypothetical protein
MRTLWPLGPASAWMWAGLLSASAVHAESTCDFAREGNTLRLLSDCETDETLMIPDGLTLDGQGHRIVAVDPPGGGFAGAVVRSAGTEAYLRRLVIDAGRLAAICHPQAPEDQRLRAVLFVGASGSIVDNHVVAINQGPSGCQEGTGIEVRPAPAGSRVPRVLIRGNRIEHYQKTGIFVQGPLEAQIYFNRVQGEGPLNFIAQNGIHLTDGVRGEVKFNHVSDTIYTGSEVSSTGLLVVGSDAGLALSSNHVAAADVNIRLVGVRNADVRSNFVEQATYDGIALDGLTDTTARNRVAANRIEDCDVGVSLFGRGATSNTVVLNRIDDSSSAAIQEAMGAHRNLIFNNTANGAPPAAAFEPLPL